MDSDGNMSKSERKSWVKTLEEKFLAEIMEDEDFLEEMAFEDIFETADGCSVEPDGKCPHGFSSPLILMGVL